MYKDLKITNYHLKFFEAEQVKYGLKTAIYNMFWIYFDDTKQQDMKDKLRKANAPKKKAKKK
jgi:hypothetical protein